MNNFKYAIFDMDGTLLDSMSEWKNLGRDYLVNRGIKVPDNINDILNSMTVNEATLYFQKEFGIKENSEQINSDILKMIENKFLYELKLKPFVKEYLEKLRKENVNMCIATATPTYLAKAAMERLNVLHYFSFIVCCDDVGIGKTMPDIFHHATNKLNANLNEVVVFEDSDYAMKTSKDAGFFTVGVFDENLSKPRKEIEALCHKYIESFQELI
ncbi:MAG: putative hydrolase [Bacillota bacterium]|jgi:HAD superfamily hydrolase (TIGR01509 family)|nr:putative hydrolase [Bacillota bacterium]